MGIKQGQRVYLKPEWQDEGDDGVTFVAAADQYADGFLLIRAELGMRINPTQTVAPDMIERAD